MNEPVTLDPLYYRDNFERLCATVQSQYLDVLLVEEIDFFKRYSELEEAARCLFIRLVSRRGPLFRREQLRYRELGELEPCVTGLLAAGLLRVETTPEPDVLLNILRKDELLAIYGELLAGRKSQRKMELQEHLLSHCETDALLQAWRDWCEPGCDLLEVQFQDCIELLQLLFFGNGHQSLTEFVLSDLGVMRYWDYPLDRAYRLFESRAQIDTYRELSAHSDSFYQAVADEDSEAVLVLASVILVPLPSSWLEQRRQRLCNRVARQLERYQQWPAALQLYASCEQHPSRERRVRILQTLEQLAAAADLCAEMQASPRCEAEVDFVRRQLPALRKKLGQAHVPLARESFAEETLTLARQPGVEIAAAEHYAQHWEQVGHVENTLVNAAFGLAFWEQIFLPLPGAFVNPFQAAPLDMYSGDFYRRRRQSLDQRLQFLAHSDLPTELLTAFDRYREISNRWVNWRALSREFLANALRCIPVAHWLLIWRRILFDPQANRSGLPDLLALDPQRGYCLIEVKGPGDQLQLNQKRWLRYFAQHAIPARVARVQWADA